MKADEKVSGSNNEFIQSDIQGFPSTEILDRILTDMNDIKMAVPLSRGLMHHYLPISQKKMKWLLSRRQQLIKLADSWKKTHTEI